MLFATLLQRVFCVKNMFLINFNGKKNSLFEKEQGKNLFALNFNIPTVVSLESKAARKERDDFSILFTRIRP